MIPKTETAVRPQPPAFSETPTKNRPPPWYEEPDSPATAGLRLYTPQAEGRDKAMDLERQDKVDDVVCKLKALYSFFEFFLYARDSTSFSEGSIEGLCVIIRDCIGELEEAVGTGSE